MNIYLSHMISTCIQEHKQQQHNNNNSNSNINTNTPNNKLIQAPNITMLIKSRITNSPVSPTHRSEISFHRESTDPKTNQFMTIEKQHRKYKKMVAELEVMLKQEKLKYSELEERMEMMKKRAALREKQFHNILVKTCATVNEWAQGYSDQNSKREEVIKTFQRITNNFENVNEATNNFIEKRYIQNINKAQSKIAHIMQIAHNELFQLKKITQLDKLAIQRVLEQVCLSAQKIDDENIEIRERLADQQLKRKLLHEEKKLLLNQIVMKKRIINQLYLQNKQIKLRSNRDNRQKTEQLESILERACADQRKQPAVTQSIQMRARYSEQQTIKQETSTQLQRRSGRNNSQKSKTSPQPKLGQFITQINLKKPALFTPRRQKHKQSVSVSVAVGVTARSYSKKASEDSSRYKYDEYDRKCQLQRNIDQMRVSMKKDKITVVQLEKTIADYKFLFEEIKQIVGETLHIKPSDSQQQTEREGAALTQIQKLLQSKKPNQSMTVLHNNFAQQTINNLIQDTTWA